MRQRVTGLRSPARLASTIMRWGVTTGSLGALLCAGVLGLLLSAPAASHAQDITNPLHGNPEAIAKGYNLYHRYCSICHGTRARGAKGPSLRDEVWTWGGSDTDVFTTIVAGRPNTLMGAFGARVQPLDIWAIIAYLRTEYRGALYDAREKGVLTVCAMPNQLPASDKSSPGGFDIASGRGNCKPHGAEDPILLGQVATRRAGRPQPVPGAEALRHVHGCARAVGAH